jgi:hypothetical protein
MPTSTMGQLLNKSLQEILQELRTEDTELKEKALETLAFYFIRQLGLKFKAWRKRNEDSEWAEVNAIAEGDHLVFSRWQIQCIDAPDHLIPEDDIAVQVGLSMQLKSNVILMATTGLFSRKALSYADAIMRQTSLNIITIDIENLQALATSPQALIDILGRKAKHVMELKILHSNIDAELL